jgi:prefoldin subunit 5
MEQIQKLKAELEQVQKELRELCNKAWNKNHFKYYYVPEINKLSRKKTNLQTKINQLRQKNWYWE